MVAMIVFILMMCMCRLRQRVDERRSHFISLCVPVYTLFLNKDIKKNNGAHESAKKEERRKKRMGKPIWVYFDSDMVQFFSLSFSFDAHTVRTHFRLFGNFGRM